MPKKPQELATQHDCINLRLPTHGGLWSWSFKGKGREVKIRREGQMVEVLAGYNMVHPGYYLYYTSRLQSFPTVSLLLEALRYRG